MRVLHVADNPADARMTRSALARLAPGWRLEQSGTLADAWARLDAQGPSRPRLDLALVDLRLPDGSGLELLTRIHKFGHSANTYYRR